MRFFYIILLTIVLGSCQSGKSDGFKLILESEIQDIKIIERRARDYFNSATSVQLDSRHILMKAFLRFTENCGKAIYAHCKNGHSDLHGLKEHFDSLTSKQKDSLKTMLDPPLLRYFDRFVYEANSKIKNLAQESEDKLHYIAAVCTIKKLILSYFAMHDGIHCGFGPHLQTRLSPSSRDSMLLEILLISDRHNPHPFSVYYYGSWHNLVSKETIVGRFVLPVDAKPTQLRVSADNFRANDYEILFIPTKR
jgi:hypothetical protein